MSIQQEEQQNVYQEPEMMEVEEAAGVGEEGVSVMKRTDRVPSVFPAGALEPKFDNDFAAGGVFCPELKLNLHPGGWCLHSSINRPASVARIIEVVGPKTCVINFFPEVDYAEHTINPPVDDVLRGLTELYQSPFKATVSVTEIKKLCFVFHKSEIINNNMDIYGMRDVHFISKRQQFTGEFVNIPGDHCLDFPSSYGSPKHKSVSDANCEVFRNMEVLKKTGRKMMVKNDSEPGDYGVSYAKNAMSKMTWNYMKGMVDGTTTMHEVELKKKEVILRPRMRLESWQKKVTVETLSFTTDSQLQQLRSVLGQFIGIGMQVGVPKIGSPSAHLGESDFCYLLLCKSQLHAIRSRVPRRGLGFFMKFNGTEVNLGCTYRRILYSDLSRDDRRLNSIMMLNTTAVNTHNPAQRHGEATDRLLLEIGMEFNMNGATYEITSLDDPNNIRAVVLYPEEFSGDEIHSGFTITECEAAVRETLGEL